MGALFSGSYVPIPSHEARISIHEFWWDLHIQLTISLYFIYASFAALHSFLAQLHRELQQSLPGYYPFLDGFASLPAVFWAGLWAGSSSGVLLSWSRNKACWPGKFLLKPTSLAIFNLPDFWPFVWVCDHFSCLVLQSLHLIFFGIHSSNMSLLDSYFSSQPEQWL